MEYLKLMSVFICMFSLELDENALTQIEHGSIYGVPQASCPFSYECSV